MPDHVASVFISHAEEDEAFVREFCAHLEVAGFWVWLAKDQLPGGGSQSGRISEAIDQVDFYVALVSEAFVDSSWCRWELSLAVSTAIERDAEFVLPVRVDGSSMPTILRDKCYVDARKMGPRPAADKMIDSMREYLRPTRMVPPRQVRQPVSSRPTASSRATRRPKHRLRSRALLGAVLAVFLVGPMSPVASFAVIEPGGALFLPYY